jgi:hypothetical protein
MNVGPIPSPDPGLCGTCRHARRVTTRRGSVFLLCRRAATDSRYRRYPPLPVLACAGYEADAAGEAAGERSTGTRSRVSP